jgi:hypothetical protein
MFDLEKGLTEVQIPTFERVTATEKFGDEILTIGMKEGRSWLMLEDGKNEALRVDLHDRDMSHTKLSQHSGAYFITTKKEVLVYYKGATELLTLASGDILGMFDTTIFYNKDGVTYKMTLEGVE